MSDLLNAEEVYLRYITEYNEKDLEQLLLVYRDGLFLFLLGFVKSEEPDFDPNRGGSFKGWLYAIARNNALMHIRRGKMKTVPLEEELLSDEE